MLVARHMVSLAGFEVYTPDVLEPTATNAVGVVIRPNKLSITTVSRLTRTLEMRRQHAGIDADKSDLVIVAEAHHYPAEMWRLRLRPLCEPRSLPCGKQDCTHHKGYSAIERPDNENPPCTSGALSGRLPRVTTPRRYVDHEFGLLATRARPGQRRRGWRV